MLTLSLRARGVKLFAYFYTGKGVVWVRLEEFGNVCKTSIYAIKQQIMSHWNIPFLLCP